MNKLYSLLAGATVLVTSSSMAQLAIRPVYPCTAPASAHTNVDPADLELRGGGALWSEDFANGILGNNPSGAWTLDGPDGAIWHFGTTAPRGAYTPNTERIQSTTFANGFAKFASDSANCTWNGNTPTALPVEEFTDWDGSLVSPVIDLSATPAVILSWQQRARYCCGSVPFLVEVSTDGFNTWSTFSPVPLLQVNTLTATQTIEFSITGAISANPGNTQFRFHHDGANAGTSHYHWQVDDIQIIAAPAVDGRVFSGYCSHRGDGTEFGRIPQNQLGATMNLGALLENMGATALTNATITAVVTDDLTSTQQFTASGSVASLAPGDTLFMDEYPTLPTLAPGAYTVTFTATSDEIAGDPTPNNNVTIRTFEVTESGPATVYSFDQIGGHPDGTEILGSVATDQFTGAEDELWGLTYYPIITDFEVNAIEIVLTGSSVEGGTVRVAIHDSTAVRSDDVGSPFIESDDYIITASDIDNGVLVVPLSEPFTMTPGAYYAGAVMFSNAGTSHFGIIDDLTVPQPPWASNIFIDQTYTNPEALAIRLRSGFDGITENELKGVGVYPNPTEGILNITFTRNDDYTVEVSNILGEVVSKRRVSGTTSMDISEFASGVYNVRVSTDEAATVQRVVKR